jgi:hypothetical protein
LGTLNLLAGTAHGKIGQFQFQTRGLKCVVRTKQPQGLTNSQAETVNKPVLQKLSACYHLWAKYMLETFDTDYKKPQALWNYYTELNKHSFIDGVTERTGWHFNKKAGASVPAAVYYPDSANNGGRLEFSEPPPSEYLNRDVLLIFGLDKKPIAQCQKVYAPYGAIIENLPCIATEEDVTLILGFIVTRTRDALISGAFTVTAGPDSGLPFWNAPQEFINGGIAVNYTAVTASAIAAQIDINESAVPAQFAGYKWRFTFSKNLGAYLAGSVVTAQRGQPPEVAANCEAWESGETIALVELTDPSETSVCSPPINLLSAFSPRAPATFGVAGPSAFSWAAGLDARVTLTYIPVLAPVAAPLAHYRETATLTQAFGSLAAGTEIQGLFQTPYARTGITGTPPIQDRCAESVIYDTRTDAPVCALQHIDSERSRIIADAAQLSALVGIYQTGLLKRGITTTAKLAAERIPVQYQDCVFSLTFNRAAGGMNAGSAAQASVTADTPLTPGAAFPPAGVPAATARLYSPQLQKSYSLDFDVLYAFETLGASGESPFTVTVTTEVIGGGDVLCTLSFDTAAYRDTSYYEGTVEISFTRPIYDRYVLAFESEGEAAPIQEGAESYVTDEDGSPFVGPNGSAEFTRQNDAGDWITIVRNARVFTSRV